MNMTLAIVITALAVISYSVLDHAQDKKRNALAALVERVDVLEKRVASCEENITDIREDVCSSVPLPGQSSASNN